MVGDFPACDTGSLVSHQGLPIRPLRTDWPPAFLKNAGSGSSQVFHRFPYKSAMTSPRCDPHGRVMIWPRLHRQVPETGPTLPPLRGSGPFQIRAGVCRRAKPQLVRVLNESQAAAVPRSDLSRLAGRACADITNVYRRIRGISVQHRIALENNQRTGQQAWAARPTPDLAIIAGQPIRRSGR